MLAKFSLVRTKALKPLLTKDQKLFKQLRKKIEDLQIVREMKRKDLDASLQFFYEKILPEAISLRNAVVDRTKITYKFYKAGNGLSQKDCKVLRDLILEDIHEIFSMCNKDAVAQEVKEIFKELHGSSYEEFLEKDKNDMEAIFGELDLDLDFAGANTNDSEDAFENKDGHFQEKKKTKKELKKEASEEIQHKGFNAIYRQLARILHPDLEQDDTQKAVKEELMKKLTSINTAKDLYGLLTLEMEWINQSNDQASLKNDEQIRLYNAMFKNQIEKLQNTIDMLPFSQRYMPIRDCYDNVKDQYRALKIDVKNLQQLVIALKTSDKHAIFKKIIKQKRECAKR